MSAWSTPWPTVTPLLDLRPGAVSVAASLSTVGKTTFAINVAAHNGFAGVPVIYGTTESTLPNLQEKVLTAHLGLDVRTHGMGAERRAEADELGELLDRGPLYFLQGNDETGVAEVARSVLRVTDPGRPAPLVVIDSIQGFSKPADPKSLDHNMRALKQLAQDHDAAVVVVSHLQDPSRGQPELRHLAEAVTDTADTVLSLHRATSYWGRNIPQSFDTTLQVLKGACAGSRTRLTLEAPLCRFVSTEPHDAHHEELHASLLRQRGDNQEAPQRQGPGREVACGLLTADGTLGFVRCTIHEVREILQERGEMPPGEREIEHLHAIPGLVLYHAVPFKALGPDRRPLNLVANTLIRALNPHEGSGRFRGTVAFLNRAPDYTDITAEQRAQLTEHYRQAHKSVRTWQSRREGDGR